MKLNFTEFETLFKTHYKSLVQAAYRIVADSDTAQDLVQDVFCKFWEKHEQLEITTSTKSYLYQSAINHALNHIKKAKRADERAEFFYSSAYSEQNNSEEQLALKETSLRVHQVINGLPPACRTVFVLSRFELLSYKEIAAQLDISIKTVENHMGKALKYMHKYLGLFLAGIYFLITHRG